MFYCITCHVVLPQAALQMNSLKDLLELVIQRMQDKAERLKGLIWVLHSLSPEGIMKLKDELMCAVDDTVSD
jgi:translation initiation factor 2 alpha subunit (eIF-2alpha)